MAKRRFAYILPALFLALVIVSGALVWKFSQPDPRLPGDLNFARTAHTATLLPNGNVLVVGGKYYKEISYEDGVRNMIREWRGQMFKIPVSNYHSCEMYNPITHSWTVVDSLNSPRVYSAATQLKNGRVLVVGGLSSYDGEVFDPVRGTWQVTGTLATQRAYCQAILMANGEVLLVDGAVDGLETFTDLEFHCRQIHNTPVAETYNPSTNTWKAIPQFNFLFDARCIALSNGKVLIAGGWDLKKNKPLTNCYLYDPVKDTFSATGSLINDSQPLSVKLADGRVLLIGDKNCELYDPITQSWTKTARTISTISFGSTATLLQSGQVLLISCSPTGDCELYDPKSGGWSLTGRLKTHRAGHTATCLKDGRVLIIGGEGRGELSLKVLASCEAYDPKTGTWGEP